MPHVEIHKYDLLPRKASSLFGILLVSMICLQVGCWSEVAYEPVALNEDTPDENDEAAPFEPDEDSEAPPFSSDTSALEDTEIVVEEEPTTSPDAENKITEEAVKPTPPWMRKDNQSSELSEDAARYFGGTDDSTNLSPPTETVAEETEELDKELDDFIAMLEKTEVASSTSEETKQSSKQKSKPVDTVPTSLPETKLPEPSPSSQSLVGSRYGSVAPVVTKPLDFDIPKTPRKKKEPVDETPEPEPFPETKNITGSRYADVETKPSDRLPWEIDEPASEVNSAEEVSQPQLPEKETVVAEEPTESPSQIAALEPKQPTFAEQAPPKLASLDPLPSVPVLSYNTQHLAWLLGGKLGLAHLAASEGATEEEVAIWIKETEVLSSKLEIPLPQLANDSQDVATQVTTLLEAAARTSEDLQIKHGINHAALLEISLKTNALLVLSEKHPELAPAIAKAVEEAAERAELPNFLWRKMHQVLIDGATPDEIFEAVSEMHDNVESYLR